MDSPDPESAAGKLRAWREKQGLSQKLAADHLGVRQATWCEWESGTSKRGPNRDLAIRIEALTAGAVPIDAWSADPAVAEAMDTVVRRRAERDETADSAAHTTSVFAPPKPAA